MADKVQVHPDFQDVYQVRLKDSTLRLATENLTLGRNVYGEKLVKIEGAEFRLWDPYRSKIAAAILKGLKYFPIRQGNRVLYLGAASGTTASHVSDIIGESGHVFCIEFAPRSIRDLIDNVCRFRANMSPILSDARFPSTYTFFIDKVDSIYCDIAQPEQAKILVDNTSAFLVQRGWIMIAIKSRSIDVARDPSEIYDQQTRILEKSGFKIKDTINLEPYDKDHAMIVAQSLH